MDKIYRIQYIIPNNDNNDNNGDYCLLEINTEEWTNENFEDNLNKELLEFNKNNPIPIEYIETKMLKLIYFNNEFIWMEY